MYEPHSYARSCMNPTIERTKEVSDRLKDGCQPMTVCGACCDYGIGLCFLVDCVERPTDKIEYSNQNTGHNIGMNTSVLEYCCGKNEHSIYS